MIIKDCFKDYDDGAIGKVIPPERTCEVILKKLRNSTPLIFAEYLDVQTQLGAPQVRVIGTDEYQKFTRPTGQNGKGHSRVQALASGLMELVERYSCGKYLKNDIGLVSSFRNLELKGNPFHLEDILKYPHLRGSEVEKELETAKIAWYKGYTLEEEKVYIPMNLIRYLLEGTNGMASGNSLEEALLHGICEVIERHFMTLIESRKIKTPFIDKSTISLPIAKDLIKRAESLGQEVYVKDFSLGFGMPIIGVIRKINKSEFVVTVGVATDRNEALTRGLTENSQSQGSEETTRKISTAEYHFMQNETISMEDIPNISNPNISLEIKNIKELLCKQHMRVFFIITTDKILNVPCVYAYIPQCKNLLNDQLKYRNTWMGLILESLITKNYEGARKYIRKASRNDKANQAIYRFYQGIYLRSQSRYREAIPYFLNTKKTVNRMAHLEPMEKLEIRSFCIVNLALCYRTIGNINAAIYFLVNLYVINPSFSFKQLYNYYSIGLIPEKRELFNEMYDLYQDIRALRNKLPRKKPAEFLKIFYRYFGCKEKILPYLKQALHLFKNKKYTKAVIKAKKAADSSGAINRLYNIPRFLGICYQRMGKFPEAIREFKKAEEIDPIDPQINIFLARCLKNNGDVKLWKKTLNKGLFKLEKPTIHVKF